MKLEQTAPSSFWCYNVFECSNKVVLKDRTMLFTVLEDRSDVIGS